MAEVAARVPLLVNPAVTQRKVQLMLEAWEQQADLYRRRGWIMLRAEGTEVEVAFVSRISISTGPLSVISVAILVDFSNYDLWPPSVRFIDPQTREFLPPPVAALMVQNNELRNLLINGHPETNEPFLCVVGTRQYHSHPQHSGDSWLIHRASDGGTLVSICEQVWLTMARNVLGLRVTAQSLPPPY